MDLYKKGETSYICSVASWENVSSRKPLKTVEEISYLCSCGVRGVGGDVHGGTYAFQSSMVQLHESFHYSKSSLLPDAQAR